MPEREGREEMEGGREKGGGKSKSSSKSKDLSHVPCKFYKVGSCTAGSACPFSHNIPDTGGQKDVCAWFVKGNCKFGHKCALAHVLPGQSMSMDKKNKKAAQAAAAGGKDGGKGTKSTRREGQQGGGSVSAGEAGAGGGSGSGRGSLFAGSTAPTRILQGSARSTMPMPLKVALSPSAPAPPLQDTEFAQFGLPDDDGKLDSAPAVGRPRALSQEEQTSSSVEEHSSMPGGGAAANTTASKSPPSPIGLPVNSPQRPALAHHSRPSNPDFGPIGSPTRSVTSGGASVPRPNGFASGTSPSRNNYRSDSPFSAPGSQSVFVSYDDNPSTSDSKDFRQRSGLAASLGTSQMSRAWNNELGPVPSQVSNRSNGRHESFTARGNDEAIGNEDLEDFIPGSLTDLLTPEERSRRMSRSTSGQPPTVHTLADRDSSGVDQLGQNVHRYSRSVPAPSLLGDISSIWSDQSAQANNPMGLPGSPSRNINIGNGTPTSFKSSSAFGGRSFNDDQFSSSPSMLSPSNASAAFLPGLHQNYKSRSGFGGGDIRTTGTHLQPPTGNTLSAQYQPSTTLSASHLHTTFASRFGGGTNSQDALLSAGRPILASHHSTNSGFGFSGHNNETVGRGGVTNETMATALSPSARALQAHAPGQSLPQGLAAGYSRIHALPPAAGTGLSPSYVGSPSPGVTGNWGSLGGQEAGSAAASLDAKVAGTPPGGTTANAALESMFSRLSYSAAASRASPVVNVTSSTGATPPLSRNVSGGRQWPAHAGALSPLSGPVVTGDDDELFSMDG